MKRTTFTSLVTLAALPFSLIACGGDGGGGGGDDKCTPGNGGQTAKYVVNTVTVPTDKSQYAIDLNGDSRTDNQLGNIIGALSQQGLNVQMGVSDALTKGLLVILATETSTDASFQADKCAGVQLQLGSLPTGTTTPDYSGNGTFTASGANGDVFAGPIAAGKFNSASPVTATDPVNVTIALPLVPDAVPVTLKITGAHLTFTRGADGKVMTAQLQGAIKDEDVKGDIIPNVATLLTGKINEMPCAGTCADIGRLFDTGGTKDPTNGCADGCKTPTGCAAKGDKKIDVCEVATSGLIQNVLAPDVQMFQGGVYKPNKANETKDSLSLGLQFSMVPAKF
jgi:hypothetical protein